MKRSCLSLRHSVTPTKKNPVRRRMRCTAAHAAITAVAILAALVEASGASAVRLQNPVSPPPRLYSAHRPKHWRVGEADGIDLVSSPPPAMRKCRVCCKSSVHDADNPSFFSPPSHSLPVQRTLKAAAAASPPPPPPPPHPPPLADQTLFGSPTDARKPRGKGKQRGAEQHG